jgi:short subunit dehydrogenase-like uncharacterized protein
MKVIIMANAERALPRNYDLIVYGASGFTGRLVAEHLLGTYGRDGRIRWAMAGRRYWEARDALRALRDAEWDTYGQRDLLIGRR